MVMSISPGPQVRGQLCPSMPKNDGLEFPTPRFVVRIGKYAKFVDRNKDGAQSLKSISALLLVVSKGWEVIPLPIFLDLTMRVEIGRDRLNRIFHLSDPVRREAVF